MFTSNCTCGRHFLPRLLCFSAVCRVFSCISFGFLCGHESFSVWIFSLVFLSNACFFVLFLICNSFIGRTSHGIQFTHRKCFWLFTAPATLPRQAQGEAPPPGCQPRAPARVQRRPPPLVRSLPPRICLRRAFRRNASTEYGVSVSGLLPFASQVRAAVSGAGGRAPRSGQTSLSPHWAAGRALLPHCPCYEGAAVSAHGEAPA